MKVTRESSPRLCLLVEQMTADIPIKEKAKTRGPMRRVEKSDRRDSEKP